ncbi:hypothetical protein CRG98_024767 [Punica granatum]|uniref:Uncharacterized protein n=1 Tax=Punica granatum TaxID=22663 RepID=A0A2I0JGS6_PUNGR|nr:hypothetical protein CRG98_024767 [Punica granatum]
MYTVKQHVRMVDHTGSAFLDPFGATTSLSPLTGYMILQLFSMQLPAPRLSVGPPIGDSTLGEIE